MKGEWLEARREGKITPVQRPSPMNDIRLEPVLQGDWTFQRAPREAYAPGVLITGPNSFIGIFVLDQLLRQHQGPIHCLMRARSQEHAAERLRAAALRWGLELGPLERAVLHVGEVTQPRWGLSAEEYDGVRQAVGSVVHLALNARYFLPYSHYRDTWLPELVTMIGYCADPSAPKALHYPGSYNSHFFTDAASFARLHQSAWHSGYTGFKWVTEQLLRRAFGGNLEGCLYDIPLVFGAASTGLCPDTYSARHILHAFMQTGIAVPFKFKIVTVDALARIIAANVLLPAGENLRYVRPVLDGWITREELIACLPAGSIREGTHDELMSRSAERMKAGYLLPADFEQLIESVHALPAIVPPSFDSRSLPDPHDAFAVNVRAWAAKPLAVETASSA